MESRELPADDFAGLAEDRQAWWLAQAGVWHALDAGRRTRCGLTVEDPPFHAQQVVAEAAGTVVVCRGCLAEMGAADEPATAGELLVDQFRLYYVE